jgi:hypothetical protein
MGRAQGDYCCYTRCQQACERISGEVGRFLVRVRVDLVPAEVCLQDALYDVQFQTLTDIMVVQDQAPKRR